MLIWGDGTQTCDLVHVSDLARLLVAATQFGDGEVFDGGSGHAVTVNEVAAMVAEVTGCAKVEHRPMRRGELPTTIRATGENWHLLDGWRPSFNLDELAETIRWYR